MLGIDYVVSTPFVTIAKRDVHHGKTNTYFTYVLFYLGGWKYGKRFLRGGMVTAFGALLS